MLTERDEKVVEFLNNFKAAKTSVLQQLFFPSYKIATKRLAALANAGEIKRERNSQNNEYIYYVKRPTNLRHALTLTDVYAMFRRQSEVDTCVIEPEIGDIRPDAIITYKTENGKLHLACIEVELSNKGLDLQKYIRLRDSGEYIKHFPVFPEIYVVTDKKIPKTDLNVMVIPTKIGGAHGGTKPIA